MTEPMTDARLAEIARVHASVDRFPFTSDRYGVLDVDGDWITDSYGLFWTEELAEFVALSSTAVPELISEIRRLREENERLRAEAERRSDERDAVTDARGFLKSRNNPHESDAQLIRRLGACCGVLEQERDAALARAEKAEAEVEEWKSKATSYDYDRRDACAEVRRLTAERRADELAVKLDGTIVVRDDAETVKRLVSRLQEMPCAPDGEPWSNHDLARAVLAALREAYQRGEQDSRPEGGAK